MNPLGASKTTRYPWPNDSAFSKGMMVDKCACSTSLIDAAGLAITMSVQGANALTGISRATLLDPGEKPFTAMVAAPARRPVKLFCVYYEAEEEAHTTYHAALMDAARPVELSGLAQDLLLDDPNPRSARGANAVEPREPRVGSRLALLT